MDEDILKSIGQNKTIDEVLNIVQNVFDLIVNQDKWINDFYLHPLGFYYCRLLYNEEHQVRLHIWEPNYKVKEDLFIHDHFYDLCSWVLCGKIADYTYEVIPTNEKTDYCMFTSSYLTDKNVRILTKTDNFLYIKMKEKRIIKKNEKYIIQRDTFHSNKILFDQSDLTTTFVFTFNHKDNHSPNVVGLSKNNVYLESDPMRISPDKVKELINKTAANLDLEKVLF
jgi:hypothetical protein